MGLLYLLAFLIAANQYLPLLGERGLLPVRLFLARSRFWKAPSLFWLNCSDRFIGAVIGLGLALSILALSGISDASGVALSVGVWALLWLLYLSLVNVGQVFYGYGWEILLLECGFLTIFWGSTDSDPPALLRWLLLWVLFRVMFGAGMIKLRADRCWRDLTCMYYHFETQPLPNPLSRYFHFLPRPVLKGGVLLNHVVELVAPWFVFAPPPLCYVAGGLQIFFQVLLILSGNLSWLNYITIALCIPCFDDAFLSRFLSLPHPAANPMSPVRYLVLGLLAALVLLLSLRPARNLFSRRQRMNASFDPFHLVNTYGAFGGVTRERIQVILQGTDSDSPAEEAARWREYLFKGQPGELGRRPCVVAPYQYKLDWQVWFVPLRPNWTQPWFLHFIEKLLANDPRILALLARNPFPEKPPRFIRAELYQYSFTEPRDPGGAWWRRTYVGNYLPPMALDLPEFQRVLQKNGWT